MKQYRLVAHTNDKGEETSYSVEQRFLFFYTQIGLFVRLECAKDFISKLRGSKKVIG